MASKSLTAIFASVLTLSIGAVSTTANADTKWVFSGYDDTPDAFADYSSDGAAPDVRVSGWSNKGAASNGGKMYVNSGVTLWGGGLGAGGENSNQHGLDNFKAHNTDRRKPVDLVLFDFAANGNPSDTWRLTSVEIGWHYSDADFSVLAWTGAGVPDLTQSYLDACCGTGGLSTDLTTDGWTVVGNYDANDSDNGSNLSALTVDINSNIQSGWWLVSAYSSAFGNCAGCTDGTGTFGEKDSFKISAVTGVGPPTTDLSEPGTWLLLALGLPLIGRLRKK